MIDKRIHETDEEYPTKPPTIEEREYPPTSDEYLDDITEFRRLPKYRREFGLTWVEREWN